MSDNDNVWKQPEAPPPPLFTGKKEKDLVKQVTDELTERVIKSEVVYYPISLKHSNFHSLYGEAVDKSFLPPVHVSAYVEWQGTETTATNLGVTGDENSMRIGDQVLRITALAKLNTKHSQTWNPAMQQSADHGNKQAEIRKGKYRK